MQDDPYMGYDPEDLQIDFDLWPSPGTCIPSDNVVPTKPLTEPCVDNISCVASTLSHFLPSLEPQDAKRSPPNNGYTSKVRVLDRYKVVGFISSGTYGRVYKAVGHNGQSGEFAIKKSDHIVSPQTHDR